MMEGEKEKNWKKKEKMEKRKGKEEKRRQRRKKKALIIIMPLQGTQSGHHIFLWMYLISIIR